MHLCYVDEAGCPGALPTPSSQIQPSLVLCGLIIPAQQLGNLTNQFLQLKCRFNPSLKNGTRHFLDTAKRELKGSDLRREIRIAGRNRRRYIFSFLDDVLDLLVQLDAKLLARIYIKNPGSSFDGRAVYASSIQQICIGFEHSLSASNSNGLIIADSRTPALNSVVAHSIFTQKFQVAGDCYPHILEMPTFGHSENHIPIQITDLLCSALLVPMAHDVYCRGYINSIHVNDRDKLIRDRYALRLRALSYRYRDNGRFRGGITLSDAIAQRSASALFQ
jgi:Protein of unknown function (DUF3800)